MKFEKIPPQNTNKDEKTNTPLVGEYLPKDSSAEQESHSPKQEEAVDATFEDVSPDNETGKGDESEPSHENTMISQAETEDTEETENDHEKMMVPRNESREMAETKGPHEKMMIPREEQHTKLSTLSEVAHDAEQESGIVNNTEQEQEESQSLFTTIRNNGEGFLSAVSAYGGSFFWEAIKYSFYSSYLLTLPLLFGKSGEKKAQSKLKDYLNKKRKYYGIL